jgi:hypothetical protein
MHNLIQDITSFTNKRFDQKKRNRLALPFRKNNFDELKSDFEGWDALGNAFKHLARMLHLMTLKAL